MNNCWLNWTCCCNYTVGMISKSVGDPYRTPHISRYELCIWYLIDMIIVITYVIKCHLGNTWKASPEIILTLSAQLNIISANKLSYLKRKKMLNTHHIFRKTNSIDMCFKLIEAEWRIYASAAWDTVGSESGLAPVRHKAIIWTNAGILSIGKTPVRIILWCPITKMLIKACFLIQPLEQEGGCQKCCISLCSKMFINHFYQMKASPECLSILTYWSKYWVDILRRTRRRKV